MNIETVQQFLTLSRSTKFNFLLSIFSSLISGFIIIFIINPIFCQQANSTIVILLSFSAIIPIYILNQIGAIILFTKLFKNLLLSISKFPQIPESKDFDVFVNQIINKFSSNVTIQFFYNSPSRQIGELITIIAVYISALFAYFLNNSITFIYIALFINSVLLLLLFRKIGNEIIHKLEPKHFHPLIEQLRKDEKFKKHIAARLDRIENIIREKRLKKNE